MVGGTFLDQITHIYSTCRIFLAISYVLNDYDGSGGTRRKRNPSILVAKFLDPPREQVFNPYDGSICDFLSEAMLECETIWMYAMPPIETRKSPGLEQRIQQSFVTTNAYYVIRLPRPRGSSEPDEIELRAAYIVLVDTWKVYMERDYWDHPLSRSVVTVPDVTQLRLKNPETYEVFQIAFGRFNVYDLQRLFRVILHLARITQKFPGVPRTIEPSPGFYFLRDKLRISIRGGRPKIRDAELYQLSLRISRRKGAEQIILCCVKTSSLLSVAFCPLYQSKGKGSLVLFWKANGKKAGIGFAEIYFDDLDLLWMWAAFLTTKLSSSKKKELLDIPDMPSSLSLEDIKNLMELETRHLFELMPSIVQGKLDPYDPNSLNSHLVDLGRKIAEARNCNPTEEIEHHLDRIINGQRS
ncbi:hypothetical protein DL98DRAFT_529583 [Cadophora sp. DSE1049]|nr:hypothetical protein DL98DRAFT_529583 [Cadophora sp. DSE1049]